MSVVGLTFGTAANAIRPSAANAASVADQRDDPRVGTDPLVPGEAAGQRQPRGSRTRPAASSRDRLASRSATDQRRTPSLGRQRAAGAAQDPRGLGREVAAAGQHLVGGAVGDHARRRRAARPAPRTRPRTRGRGSRRATARVEPAQQRAPARALCSRSMPRVGSSRQHRRGDRSSGSPSTIASASRCFSPPDSSRGWRLGERPGVEPDGARAPPPMPPRSTRSWTR